MLTLFFDGGARPDVSGWGAVARAIDGTTIFEACGSLEEATCNEAEYHALISALTEAHQRGFTVVQVNGDSRLVIEQMRGKWKTKAANLKALMAEAQAIVAKFERVTFSWVPRDHNARADELANEAMDRHIHPAEAAALDDALVRGEVIQSFPQPDPPDTGIKIVPRKHGPIEIFQGGYRLP